MDNDLQYQSTTPGAVLVALLCGAAVGAARGVAFAPKSGAETRRQLAAFSGRMREKANRTYGQASAGVHQVASRGREALERGRTAYARARDKVTKAASGTYDEMSDTGRWDEESPSPMA
jgi:gas vesicle protein